MYPILSFRTILILGRLYHSYTKTVKHFADQIQNGQMPPSIEKSQLQGYGAAKIHLGKSEVPGHI